MAPAKWARRFAPSFVMPLFVTVCIGALPLAGQEPLPVASVEMVAPTPPPAGDPGSQLPGANTTPALPTEGADGAQRGSVDSPRAVPLVPTPLAAELVRAPGSTVPAAGPLLPSVPVQSRNRAGVPWIIAGAALVVGGAIVGKDAGTVLMVGGVVVTAYGLYLYF